MATKKFGKLTVVRASALKQSEALSLITNAVMTRWYNSPNEYKNAVEEFILPFVLSLPFQIKSQLHDLMLSEVAVDGDEYFDIEYFQNDMMGYHKLLAQVLHWNLDDFFTYIAKGHAQAIKAIKDQK